MKKEIARHYNSGIYINSFKTNDNKTLGMISLKEDPDDFILLDEKNIENAIFDLEKILKEIKLSG